MTNYGLKLLTAILSICDQIFSAAKNSGKKVGGFVTKERRENGRRVGFVLECLTSGETVTLAHIDKNKISETGNFAVGKYFVNLSTIEKFIDESIKEEILAKSDFIIIDEIGKMELLSNQVTKTLTSLIFESNCKIIGTVPEMSSNPLIKRIKSEYISSIRTITYDNRNNDWSENLLQILTRESSTIYSQNDEARKKLKNRMQNIRKNIAKIRKLQMLNADELNKDQLNKIERLPELTSELKIINQQLKTL